MAKSYKVWIEIEEIDEKGECKDGGDIGILPDSVGFFEGKHAKRDALARMASIVRIHGIDPENSDAVRITDNVKTKAVNLCPHCGATLTGLLGRCPNWSSCPSKTDRQGVFGLPVPARLNVKVF